MFGESSSESSSDEEDEPGAGNEIQRNYFFGFESLKTTKFPIFMYLCYVW